MLFRKEIPVQEAQSLRGHSDVTMLFYLFLGDIPVPIKGVSCIDAVRKVGFIYLFSLRVFGATEEGIVL